MSDLTIFKASAGSGKTFQLTREYLELLFKNQGKFHNILAVTFTNKATAEMRERILNELYIISLGEKSDHIDHLAEKTELSHKVLSDQATFMLQNILHNYSRFNVSTIDSFFQRILKSFTREIGLNVGFNIELNPRPIIEKAVDGLFEDISDNKELAKWLSDYAFNKVKDGNSWDIHKDLVEFSNAGFSEVFYSFDEEHLTQLLNINKFKDLSDELNTIVKSFIDKVNSFGNEFAQQISDHSLEVDDFSSKKSGVAGFFVNKMIGCTTQKFAMPGARVLTAAASDDFISGWVTKTSPKKQQVQDCVQSGLSQLVNEFVQFVDKEHILFYSALAVQKNLSVFAVLVEVFKRVLDHCNDNNLFLLPLASPFLAKLIEDDDAPFIYEKTGEYLNHFMIDEFQDTSQMQWKNFSPLIANGISQGNFSLVVGDVKQAIYRWRNSDWSLLDSGISEQFKYFDVEEKNLEYNWRSCKYVIDFNNWCFKNGSSVIQNVLNADLDDISGIAADEYNNVIEKVYDNAEQVVPEKNIETEGFVSVDFIDAEEYNDAALDLMIESIENLSEKGYQPRDMAILVRKNSEGSMVATKLMELQKTHPDKGHIFRFVSNDSVFLGSSESILLIISLISYINEASILDRAKILYLYKLICEGATEAGHLMSLVDISKKEEFFKSLPDEFESSFESFKRMSLLDLSSSLIRIFLSETTTTNETSRDDLPFIYSFQDAVLNYMGQNGSDIQGFLEWWNQKGKDTPVSISEDQNAIKIITIHKSKGLEFKAVIMPFTNWKFEPQSPLLWCSTDVQPFKEFRLLPITYSSKLKQTYFQESYANEKLKSVVDNLNLLYVALTRAQNALIMFSPLPKNSKKGISTVGDLLFEMLTSEQQREKLESSILDFNEEEHSFKYGNIPIVEHVESASVPKDDVRYAFGNYQHNLRIQLQGKEIMDLNNEAALSPRRKGSVFHKIFEFIKYKQDVQLAVDTVVRMGLITVQDSEDYYNEVSSYIQSESSMNWFSKEWEVYNERSILLSTGDVVRPDRIIMNDEQFIVIDYKFSKEKSKQHIKQVNEYMQALSKLTTKQISGYVWYVTLNETSEVHL